MNAARHFLLHPAIILIVIVSLSTSASDHTTLIDAVKDGLIQVRQQSHEINTSAIETKDTKGTSLLMWAIRTELPDVANYLLSRGPDDIATNSGSLTPMMTAK